MSESSSRPPTSAAQEDTMTELSKRGTNRREFLKAAGVGAASVVTVGGLLGTRFGSRLLVPDARAATQTLSLVASDGYITMPGRENDPIYIFGFVDVSGDADQTPAHLISQYKER